MSVFAQTILDEKYAHTKSDGTKETWPEVAQRVVNSVMSVVSASEELKQQLIDAITQRKFLPGGRYLYASGNELHQVNNCLLLKADDTREGWADLLYKASMSLMTGAGIGTDYSNIRPKGAKIAKTGGYASGPLALMQMVNESGRFIRQGGNRRAAIWAGLNWQHPDIFDFIKLKDWSPEIKALKAQDYNAAAPLDNTNVSVLLDDEFFLAIGRQDEHAVTVFRLAVESMLKNGEPGFSIDCGPNKGETLRNACVPGEVEILTSTGYRRIDSCLDQPVDVWNGFEWSRVQPKITGEYQELVRVTLSSGQTLDCTPNHEFPVYDVAPYKGGELRKVPACDLQIGQLMMKAKMPVVLTGEHVDPAVAYSQGFWSAEGMDGYKFASVYAPKYDCIPRLIGKVSRDGLRNERKRWVPGIEMKSKSFVPFDWDHKSRLAWLAGLIDGDGTVLAEGGVQIASIDRAFLVDLQLMLTTLGVQTKLNHMTLAGVKPMPDGQGGVKDYYCQDCYRLCIGAVEIAELWLLGLRCSRVKIGGHLPNRNASRFVAIESVEALEGRARYVYCFNEPLRHLGTFNGIVTGQCTEVTSADDSDVCNLASINLARIESQEELEHIVNIGTAFLVAGTVYSDLPYAKVHEVREKNRRLGLGLMGIHEWLIKRGKPYAPDGELASYLEIYASSTEQAEKWADQWNLSRPVKTRAIAPTGTIGIIAETTTGIEPIFCVAYKRRYLVSDDVSYQYVIDPTAKRLIEHGVEPTDIEDATTLANDVERRLKFQAWVQQYVDHGISSTINLPAWGHISVWEFGHVLLKYLPKLRGVTVYPDGARSGQPLTAVSYTEAVSKTGQIFIEATDVCEIGKGESCGA